MDLVPVTSTVLAMSTVQAVGAVIFVIALIGMVVYLLVNLRAGHEEIGSEVELAPNRKPYYEDDVLETTKLNRTLASGVALLGVVAVGLPLYWLNEPGRQDGAVDTMLSQFEGRGFNTYEEGAQCVNCHGPEGSGGQATYTVLDADNEFVASVNWRAPALDTVLLRFDREEVISILDYGRPGTPMPAWGAGGGGPLSTQQLENVVDYLASIQLTAEEAQHEAEVGLATELGLLTDEDKSDEEAVERAIDQIDYDDLATGEAAFNLGETSGVGTGAYACARCHTRGWSIIQEGEDPIQPAGADVSDVIDYLPGSGAYGPALDEVVPRQFFSVNELAEFVSLGNVDGEGYGLQGQGDGMMPGFGDNPNTPDTPDDGMMPREMVCAIAEYEATLRGDDPPSAAPPSTTTTSTTVAPTTTTTQADEAQAEGEGDEGEAEESSAPEAPFCSPEALEALDQ
jgi:mono/diheme cytochrome c family protein